MQARSVSDIGQWGAVQAVLPALSFLLLLLLLHIPQSKLYPLSKLMQLIQVSSPTPVWRLLWKPASLLSVQLHAR